MLNDGEMKRAAETLYHAEFEAGHLPAGGTPITDREIFAAGFRAGLLYAEAQLRSQVAATERPVSG